MIELTRAGKVSYLPDEEQERAMELYWAACRAGDESAQLKKVAGPVPPDEPPPEEPPPAPQASLLVPEPTVPGVVSQEAVERIQLHERWLRDSGFDLSPPLYAPGTRVLPLGDRNFRLERRRVETLPLFSDSASRAIETIRREERREITLPLRELQMAPSGALRVGEDEFGLEPSAFHQLAGLSGFGAGARYLARMCSAELRAQNVNVQLRKVHHRKQVVLRARNQGAGRPVIFAAVTPTYSVCDTDEVLQAVLPELADARTELAYDGAGIRATALFMPETVVDLAAGDVFKAGVRISTDDTGQGRIRISAVVYRNRCLNLIVIEEGSVETVSQVHRGSPERMLEIVGAGVAEARAKVAGFLEAWGHARSVRVDPETTFRTWLRKGSLKVPTKEKRKDILEALLQAHSREPGDTLADAVNAVTRAAHEHRPWGQEVRESLERQASKLVYAAA